MTNALRQDSRGVDEMDLPGSDIDLMRDVYMTKVQREAFDRICAALEAAREDAWTDAQCMVFASVAFRHAPKNLPDGVTLKDIRIGAKRAIDRAQEGQS